MKKCIIIFLWLLAISFASFAQLPQGVNYQGVARDMSGNVLKNISMDVRLGIYHGTSPGELLWQEVHVTSTNEFGVFSIVLGDSDATQTGGSLGNFSEIDWSSGDFYLETAIDIHDGNGFQVMGTSPVLAVPYAYYAGSVGDLTSLKVRAAGNENPDSALFEVKRSDGQTVFAVYPEGVRVYVDTSSVKGPRGGFAIGGFGAAKGGDNELFRVTPDSIRIYLDPQGKKGSRGGFAIGGYGAAKGTTQEFLRVTPDSVRVYIDDRNLKGTRGGFAIGGFGASKKTRPQYFNVSGRNTADIINPSEPRIMWIPKKEAFLTGRVLIEHPDSVGRNSLAIGYEVKAVGDWSVALGYQSIARGQNSMAMGNAAVAGSLNSFAFGNGAQALNIGSYAFGPGAQAVGKGSVALGGAGLDQSGNPTTDKTQALGDYSFAFGLGTHASGVGSIALGTDNTSSGLFSLAMGFGTIASGFSSTALGFRSSATGPRSLAIGSNNLAEGYASVAMGEQAEAKNEFAFAMGSNAIALGLNAFAFGNSTLAQGDYSFALGSNSEAIGLQSVAFGGQALGQYSMAMGVGTKANSYGALVLGRYNAEQTLDTTSAVSPILWQATDPVLVVGNGTIDFPNNALILFKNGNLEISGILTQASDERLKKNIRPLSATLQKLKTVQPVYYEFKNTQLHPGGIHIGFLAQQIKTVFPELVTTNPNGFLSVDYPAMTAVLLQAVKEQQKTISDLQNEIGKLKNDKDELAELKKEVAELKKLAVFTTQK